MTARNVLLIVSDEHNHRMLGTAGHPIVQTPNLDGLAESGTRFERAWTPSPICVPARASLATGLDVHELGTWDSAQPYDGSVRGWAHDAADAGHHAVSIGKLHYRGGDDHGFTEEILPMHIIGGYGWVLGLDRRGPLHYPEAAELAADVGVGPTRYTRYDERVVARAEQWLADHGDGDRPWILQVCLVAPHYPLSAPAEFVEPYLDDPRVAELEIDPVEETHPAVADMKASFGYQDHFDDDLVRRARAAYFGLITMHDTHVGRLLAALDRTGRRDDTVVIATSDHGEMAGNRGLWCKSYMYHDSVGVPMLVAGPDVPAGRVEQTPTSLTDVAATIRGLVGTDADPAATTRSLVELASAGDPDRVVLSQYHDGGSTTGSFAIQTGRWTYVEHVGHAPQLFDRELDPDELHDLGTDPDRADVVALLAKVLRTRVDPEAADAAAFAAQAELIERLGGYDGLDAYTRFNHTPVPE